MLARLYGLRPTPSVIYNAIPWSWMVDWFSNLGDIISNLDAGVADRLSSDYMYIMMQKEWVREYYAWGRFKLRQGGTFTSDATSTSIAFTKTRHRGGPFGFSAKDGDLSSHQLAIMGALGLSRL